MNMNFLNLPSSTVAAETQPASHSRPAPHSTQPRQRNIKRRESIVRAVLRLKGIRLEKLGKDLYRLIHEERNAVMCLFDGVPLTEVEAHFEEVGQQSPQATFRRISRAPSVVSSATSLASRLQTVASHVHENSY